MKQKQLSPEKAREYQNRYRAKNVEKMRTSGRARYAADPLKAKRSQQRYHEKHKEKVAVARRASTLKQYGLTPIQYAARLHGQGGVCALCQSADPVHWSGRFQVDHDHVTGAVRGLLCSRCNGGLGMFNDDIMRHPDGKGDLGATRFGFRDLHLVALTDESVVRYSLDVSGGPLKTEVYIEIN